MDMIDVGLLITVILLGIATAAAVLMPIVNSLSDPKSLVKAGIGVVAIVVLFVIAYMVAGDEITAKYTAVEFTDPGRSKIVGALLITMYAMSGIAVLGIVFTEINKLTK